MSSFVHVDQPTQHPGVNRAERAVRSFKYITRGFDGSRGAATILLAAVVSALLVVANQVIDTWSEGHLLAAWIVMWTVAFAALAIFAAPARRAGTALRSSLARLAQARREAAADERMWQVALQDARVMADIQRSMNVSARAQRMMRSMY
jgi:ABC-type multidrug transport system fused ATPase/permease subunit